MIADLGAGTSVTNPAALPGDDWFTFPVAVSPDVTQVAFRSSSDLIGGWCLPAPATGSR